MPPLQQARLPQPYLDALLNATLAFPHRFFGSVWQIGNTALNVSHKTTEPNHPKNPSCNVLEVT